MPDDATMMSMDVAHVFGLATTSPSLASFKSSPASLGVKRSNHAEATSDPSSLGGASASGNSINLKDRQSFWENKMKSAEAKETPEKPPVVRKNSGGGALSASKLSAFFESQSKPAPSPVPLQPTKKKTTSTGGMVSSFSGKQQQQQANQTNMIDLNDFDEEVVEESVDEDSIGDEDGLNYMAGQHVVDDPLDESLDFMDKSVQTSGLKSIVEEEDEVSEEPDLEGSWRSRDPFELVVMSQDEYPANNNNLESSERPRTKTKSAAKLDAIKRMTNMLGQDEEEEEEAEELWDMVHQQNPNPQTPHLVEDDDDGSMEEESYTEGEYYEEGEGSMEEEVSEEDEGSMEEEEETMDEEDGSMEEEEESTEEEEEEEYSYEEESATVETERTPNTLADSASKASGHSKSSAGKRKSMPEYLLSDNKSTHSEPHTQPSTHVPSSPSEKKQKKRKSLPSNGSSHTQTSRSLLDFRAVYSSDHKIASDTSDSSRLKDFRAAYNGAKAQEESIVGVDNEGAGGDATNASVGSVASGQTGASGVNQALKTSINKALRDFEKLYGTEAAQAAVARLTQAVGEDGAKAPSTQAVVEALVSESQAEAESIPAKSDNTPKTPKRLISSSSNSRSVESTLSLSSWAMPSGLSVSSASTDEKSYTKLRQPRAQSMPSVGGRDGMARQHSESSWALTGASVASGGTNNASDSPLPEGRPAEAAATTLQIETVPEVNTDVSESEGGDTIRSKNSENETTEPSVRSSWLNFGWGRKSSHDSKSSSREAQVGGDGDHTAKSAAESSWAFGFKMPGLRNENQEQLPLGENDEDEDQDESTSSEQWLASLAKTASGDGAKALGETFDRSVEEGGNQRSEEESLGEPFEDEDEDDSDDMSVEAFDREEEESPGDPSNIPDDEMYAGAQETEVADQSTEMTEQLSPTENPDTKLHRYMQYRHTLANNQLGANAARTIEFDRSGTVDKNAELVHVEEPPMEMAPVTTRVVESTVPRYAKYRSSLATKMSQESPPSTDNPEAAALAKSRGGVDESSSAPPIALSAVNGASRFQQYRSSLAKRVAPQPESMDTVEAKSTIPSRVLSPAASASDTASNPRYQKYRSLLAKNATPQWSADAENSRNLSQSPSDRDTQKQTDTEESAFAETINNTPETAVEDDGKLSRSILENDNASAPRYQQYRSSLAKNVSAFAVAVPATQIAAANLPSDPESVNKITRDIDFSSQAKTATTDSPSEPAPSAATDKPRPIPSPSFYADYRSSLSQRLVQAKLDAGLSPSLGEESSLPSPGGAVVRSDSREGPLDEATSDEEFQSKLTNFIKKSEKGKSAATTQSDMRSSWSQLNPSSVAKRAPKNSKQTDASKQPRDIHDDQSRKIAAALASSSLYMNRNQTVAVAPQEARLESTAPEKADSGLNSNARGQGVDVKCAPGPLQDIESGNNSKDRNNDLQPTRSEKDLGRKLYLRNQCYVYGLLICLLVAMPLGIGLGIGLTRDNDEDVPVPRGISPIATPTPAPVSTAQPTGLRATASPTTSSDAGVVVTIAPTSSPVVVSIPSEPTSSPTFSGTTATPVVVDTSTFVPTSVPTSAPTFVDEELFNLLNSVSFDGGVSLIEPGSPQNQAYLWLAGNENLASLSTERRVQRFALASLYYSTDGPSWSQTQDWLTDVDECTWFSTSSGGAICDQTGAYASLDLGFNGLMGTLPPELGLLTGLTRIDLSGGVGPGITGTLPSQLSLLTALEIFTIHDNAITGPLFPGIEEWTNLLILNIRNNELSGPLPNGIGQLGSLTFMDVSSNGFSGPVPPTIGDLTSLVTMNLGDNGFTSLPASIGAMVNLGSFQAPSNSFTGSLFDDWADLVNLETLDLSFNSLSGPLPATLGELTGILVLDLSNNEFRSSIPSSYGGLSTVLVLRLNSNRLTGNVPPGFGELTDVTEVRLDDNNLVGPVPTAVCDSFEVTAPKFYLDCATPEVSCPPGICCTYCCTDDVGCECVFGGTLLEYLC
jgi:hypothetical protein